MTIRVICLLLFVYACKRATPNGSSNQSDVKLGFADARLSEASGLVASINNPGFFWTINDSGNPAEVFLIDQHATIRLVCTLAAIKNRDWEDISIDRGTDGRNYLYVADIGDNSSQYECKMIYRFEEPALLKAKERTITQFDTYVFRMPDGKRDAETILIDPDTHELFLISKREDSVGLYRIPVPLSKDTMTLTKVMSMPFHQIVAGSVSSDGRKVLLKDYNNVYLWNRGADETLVQVLARIPIEIPYQREPQGEAIAWSLDGSDFYTLGESPFGRNASLIRHKGKM